MIAVRQLQRPYTLEDLAEMPDDGRRYEILGGELIGSAAPTTKHQRASSRLSRLIGNYLDENGLGEVFTAPYDVVLGIHDIVEPDLLVVLHTQDDILTDANVIGAPTLVIEILSPSSRSIDQIRKSALYASHRVPEYWIVDPDSEIILAQRLVDDMYQPIATVDGLVSSLTIPGLLVDPEKVFFSPGRRRDG